MTLAVDTGRGLWRAWRATMTLDLRSLAVYRVGIGLLLIWDLVVRLANAEAFYTDAGILPRPAALAQFPEFASYSAYMLIGTVVGVRALMTVNLLVLIALTVGYRTRLMTCLAWLLCIWLHSRNDVVLHGGQHYLRVHLFLAMLLPLGARWSADARRAPEAGAGDRWPNLCLLAASLAVTAELAMIYAFAGILKNGKPWTTDGTALAMAFTTSNFETPLGTWLAGFPALTSVMTTAALYFERGFWPLLFVPSPRGRLRTFVVFAYIGFHLAIALTIDMGTLGPMFALPLVALLPASFWSALGVRATGAPAGAPSGGAAAGHARFLLTAAVAVAATAVAFLENWESLGQEHKVIPKPVTAAINALRLEQDWHLFAPYPFVEHGWWVLVGELPDGRSVDAYSASPDPPAWTRPDNIRARAGNGDWASYDIWLYHDYRGLIPLYGAFACRRWSQLHPDEPALKRVRMYHMTMRFRADLHGPSEPVQKSLGDVACTPDS